MLGSPKPLDHDLIGQLARNHRLLLTIEEGSIGGFGSFVQQHMLDAGLLDDGRVRLRSLVLPDRFIEHGTPEGQLAEAGLDATSIARQARGLFGGTIRSLRLSPRAS